MGDGGWDDVGWGAVAGGMVERCWMEGGGGMEEWLSDGGGGDVGVGVGGMVARCWMKSGERVVVSDDAG